MTPIEIEQRAAVIKEAHTWLRTPYHHQGRIKGAGVDCATILCEIYHAVGIVKYIDPRPYAPDWHLHRNEEVYLRWLTKFAHEVAVPRPGDVMVWKFGRCFSHAGVMVDEDFVIHAYINTPVSLANFRAEPLSSHDVKYFSPWN